MSSVQNFFTSRDNNADPATYVGQLDRLWYNPDTNSIYVSNGSTPGGVPVGLATAANAIFTNITVNGSVLGNLNVTGNITPAANNKIGGITPGPGVIVSNVGLLTIDSANLPVSFGNFYANNNILSIVNANENMIIETLGGNAEIQLVGNISFYQQDGGNPTGQYFFANKDGQLTIYVPDSDPASGAVKIIGSASGNFTPPMNTGVMLQITGQNSDASRLYNDSIGGFAAFVGRRINGTVAAPTAVQAGDEIIRISSTGYNGNNIPGTAGARIVFQATENFTPTTNGSNLSFWATAVGTNTLAQVANVTVENGVTATKFATGSTVSATGNITGGNVITPGIIRYNIGSNNAVVTQLTSKSTAVTANGRTGQITMNNAALSGTTSVTFTVNNTVVTATDTIILNIKSGATADTYDYNVAAVNSGSFNIQLRNFTNTSRSDAIVLNFAVIKVS